MKTGTTAVQRAASARRSQLLEHGVLYPGDSNNQERAIAALIGPDVVKPNGHWPVGKRPGKGVYNGPPTMVEWDELLSEVDAIGSGRAFLSYELTSKASKSAAASIVKALGSDTHIVITLRPMTAILPSMWIQMLKSARTEPFDTWLENVFVSESNGTHTLGIRDDLDHARLVERWVAVAGQKNVTVIIGDKSEPNFIPSAFEQLLGLPSKILSGYKLNRFTSNRSLSFSEAEILRQINVVFQTNSVDWDTYWKLVRSGVIPRLLRSRDPEDDEPRVILPSWAAEHAREISTNTAKRIDASGARVIGDLASLSSPGSTESSVEQSINNVPIDLASEALTGMISASLGQGSHFSRQMYRNGGSQQSIDANSDNQSSSRADLRTQRAASSHTTRELATALRIRIAHKLRTGRSKPLKS